MWQALRDELHPQGLEIVTVAMDTAGVEAAGPFIDAANPAHPSLIDQAHVVGELFGVVNVPNGVWIDEDGIIVRPAEPAFARVSRLDKIQLPEGTDPYIVGTIEAAKKIRHEPERYVAALRDWVANGPESPYALTPDEVIARSRPRPREVAEAAAHFELGQHLHRVGHPDDAVEHFRAAHRLQPDNWTYKRQAWSFVHPLQGPTDVYDSDWVSDVEKIGPENYYPALEM